MSSASVDGVAIFNNKKSKPEAKRSMDFIQLDMILVFILAVM